MRRQGYGLAHWLVWALAAAVIVIGVAASGHHSSASSTINAGAQLVDQAVNGNPADALAPADGDNVDNADATVPDTAAAPTAPNETTTTLPQYSLSAIPPDSGSGQRIIVANAANMLWVIDANGKLSDSWLVSGRDGVPYVGTYHVMSKARYTHGILGHEDISMEYATRFAISPNRKNTIDFHAIPVRNGQPMQTVDQLGTFQSGGCVRMTMEHAAWIFNNIPIGGKVVILK